MSKSRVSGRNSAFDKSWNYGNRAEVPSNVTYSGKRVLPLVTYQGKYYIGGKKLNFQVYTHSGRTYDKAFFPSYSSGSYKVRFKMERESNQANEYAKVWVNGKYMYASNETGQSCDNGCWESYHLATLKKGINSVEQRSNHSRAGSVHIQTVQLYHMCTP